MLRVVTLFPPLRGAYKRQIKKEKAKVKKKAKDIEKAEDGF
jgi:hypothetical protein